MAVAQVLLNPNTLDFLLQAATDATQIAMDYSQGNISAEQAHINLVNAGHRQRDAIKAFNDTVGYYTPGPSSADLAKVQAQTAPASTNKSPPTTATPPAPASPTATAGQSQEKTG